MGQDTDIKDVTGTKTMRQSFEYVRTTRVPFFIWFMISSTSFVKHMVKLVQPWGRPKSLAVLPSHRPDEWHILLIVSAIPPILSSLHSSLLNSRIPPFQYLRTCPPPNPKIPSDKLIWKPTISVFFFLHISFGKQKWHKKHQDCGVACKTERARRLWTRNMLAKSVASSDMQACIKH